jgi:hypothetical protein
MVSEAQATESVLSMFATLFNCETYPRIGVQITGIVFKVEHII